MNDLTNLLIALKENKVLFKFNAELVIRQARHTILLAHLSVYMDKSQYSELSPHFWQHLKSANIFLKKQHEVVKWEIQQISTILGRLGVPVIILKGGAYIAQNLEAGKGRLLSDIDIMVPESAINDVEQILKRSGWFSKKLSDYNEKYYRKWMHEIPPLVHFNRQTVLDVHHTILPPTVKNNIDAKKLFKIAIPVQGFENIYTLSPEDMVIHSAAHLFHDGELEHGLRDLVDIYLLLDEFSAQDAVFWQKLTKRAKELDLEKPLYYGLHYSKEILHSDVPEIVLKELNSSKPLWPMSLIMDFLFKKAFQPDHPSCNDKLTGIARWFLYIRSHYLRMPLYLLIPHLLHKSFISPYEEKKNEQNKLENV